jgi:hypothetical protein
LDNALGKNYPHSVTPYNTSDKTPIICSATERAVKYVTTIFMLLPFSMDAVFCFSRQLGVLMVVAACSGFISILGMIWGACISRRFLKVGLGSIGVGLLQLFVLILAVSRIPPVD